MMSIVWIVIGIVLIVYGADALTDGASALAKRFQISDIVIGLTVVAFGTSAPELTVTLMSALKGNADIAIGNVIGSNLFNTLMITGCTAMLAPIAISRSTLTREIPLCIVASLVLIFMANDKLFDGLSYNRIGRTDGLVLLIFFLIFLSYTFALAKRPGEAQQEGAVVKNMPLWKSVFYIVIGLACLIYGGQCFVDGSVELARLLGVSEAVIGLTLVAAGTSLPELATSMVAAWKKNSDMAIGNVIGSNIFNIFNVLGVGATIAPMNVGNIMVVDWIMLLVSVLMLLVFGYWGGKRVINRLEGAILTLTFVGYLAYLIVWKV